MIANAEKTFAQDSEFVNEFTDKEIQRFWKFTEKKSDDECWNWTGARLPAGYGLMSICRGSKVLKKQIKSHRVSWMIHFGKIPEKILVCHKCDNPPCGNPNHLFLGSHLENNQDRDKKGRANSPRGESHGQCKFSDEKIAEIKKDADDGFLSQKQIAEKHGCSQQHVSQIKVGTRRGHF